MLDLAEKYGHFNRTITADNFFISVSLADKLWDLKTRLLGTLRKNKEELPTEFLPNKKRKMFSSLFAFKEHRTLTSYVPKPNKCVILLSTMHHNNEVETDDPKKPQIILDYNKTKGSQIGKLLC